MADALTSAIVQVSVGTPLSEAYQAINHALFGFKEDVESLQSTRTAIEAALLDADSSMEHSNTQRDMVEKLRCELNRLNNFMVLKEAKAMRREAMGGSWFLKEARLFFSPSNQVIARFLDARKVKDMRNKFDAIARDYNQFGKIVSLPTVNQTQIRNLVWGAQATEFGIISDVIVGRDGDTDNIINMITKNTGEDKAQMTSDTLSVASIVGIGGMGKTMVARYVYNDDKVRSSFDVQFWVDVTQDFDVEDILKKILVSAMNEQPFISEMKFHDLYHYHHFIRAIGGKKFLLVLDNIWDIPDLRLKWLGLRSLLKEGALGSKVLITTRDQKVSKLMNSNCPYMLKDLTEEDSWLLFQQIAITQWHEPGVEMIGKEIAEMCPNVPLVIRSIGSLLAGKYTVQEWEAFRDDQFANFSSYGRDIIQTLKLSYDRLDTKLKLCVNYCTLFPKGIGFWKDIMIHRWIALGYVEPSYRSQSLEESGEEYMSILRNSGFLERSELRCENSEGMHFKVHDLMYDLVHSLVGSQYKVASFYTDEFDKKVHHVSFNLVTESSSYWQVPSALFKIKPLQSFIASNFELVTPKKEAKVKVWSSCYKLISNFQCLSVLELCRLNIEELPKSIGELICLKFLNLSSTHLEKLPNSLTRLLNLQSLYLNYCEELQELPKDISKLVKLRHLKLYRTHRKLTHMPLGLGCLTDLRTLNTFIVSKYVTKHGGKLAELNKLTNLEGLLAIMMKRESKDVLCEAKALNLKMIAKLRKLTIEFEYATREDEMVLECLQPSTKLKELKINGYGGEGLPYWMINDQLKTNLPNLVRIELMNCNSCRTICSMGRLLHLKSLFLEGFDNVEYIENNINATYDELPQTPFFASLEYLTISRMPKFKGWRRILSSTDQVEDQHHLIERKHAFPRLNKLDVDSVKLAIAFFGTTLTGFTSLQTMHVFYDTHGCSTPPQPQTPLRFNSFLPNLKVLQFSCCSFKVLPEELRGLSSLETLEIKHCKHLEEIPEWIGNLTALNTLEIWNSPKLVSLPRQIGSLVNLKKLIIDDCPTLVEKCQATTGEYWPYIQHIPYLRIYP